MLRDAPTPTHQKPGCELGLLRHLEGSSLGLRVDVLIHSDEWSRASPALPCFLPKGPGVLLSEDDSLYEGTFTRDLILEGKVRADTARALSARSR